MNLHQLINLITFSLITHFIADFVFQSRKMGEGKSSSLYWLSMHIATYVLIYTTISAWYLIPILGYKHFIGYIFLNGLFHFVTDYITSKCTTWFYVKAEEIKINPNLESEEKLKKSRKYMKGFWSVIGIDQMIHGITLVQTLKIFIAI